MSDQIMTYEPGTRVWCRAANTIWWPGKIVNLTDTPEEFQEYISDKKKNDSVVVRYETDQTHEIITNMNKLLMYNCVRKMEFVGKGYLLYEKQKKGGRCAFKMEHFIKDVKLAERDIGGDENIFEQFAKKDEPSPPKINISELFVPSKTLIKRRKSMAAKQTPPNKRAGKSLNVSSYSQGREMTKGISRVMTQGLYFCHGVCGTKGCSYNTVVHQELLRHSKRDKNNKDMNKNDSPKAKKSKLEDKAGSSNKKIKKQPTPKSTKKSGNRKRLQDDILKDWEDDSNDNNLDASSDLSKTIEVKTTQSSCPVESTSNKVFDFDDDDASTENVANLRHNKSTNSLLDNSGSTLNRINNLEESFSEIPVTSNSNSMMPKLNSASDQNSVLNDLKSANADISVCETKVENKGMENLIAADVSTDKLDSSKPGHFNFLQLASSKPDWMKKEKWDTLEHSQYNEVIKASTVDCDILELSKMKLDYDSRPMLPEPSELTYIINNDFEVDIPDEPEPGPESEYERRTILIPVDTSVVTYSDEEIKTMPFFQNIFKRIELGQTDGIYVEFPDAKLLPKSKEC